MSNDFTSIRFSYALLCYHAIKIGKGFLKKHPKHAAADLKTFKNNFFQMDFRTGNTLHNCPLVTIGLLSYNYSSYIEETLNSILNQTYQQIELIIIDDYSTDNSVSIIKEWMKQHKVHPQLFIHEKNLGITRSCNDVIKKAKGKYIVLFASDDIMNPERIEKQVNEMENIGSEYAFCYSDAEVINELGELRGLYSVAHKIGEFHEENIFYKFFIQGFRIVTPTLFYRKEIFDAVGLYDERLTTEDYDMFIRVLPFYKVKYCSYTGVKYRVKENTKISESKLKEFHEFYNRDRILIYLRLYREIRKHEQWKNMKDVVIKKINFHLINLCTLNSKYFYSSFCYLIKKFFLKISFKRIFILQFKISQGS